MRRSFPVNPASIQSIAAGQRRARATMSNPRQNSIHTLLPALQSVAA
jgi:hypothetical protein